MRVKILLLIIFIFSANLMGEGVNYARLRKIMVNQQIKQRGITDKRILDAFNKVKRHLFIKPELRYKAYGDFSLDIGEGQTISQPYIVAIMTYVVGPTYDKKVLEIGTGSGYSAAILAELVKEVYTIEYIPTLSLQAQKRLRSMGYTSIKFKIGDGYEGWKEHAPYDSIIVTCSEDHIPLALIDQLAIGGRMIIPVSYSKEVQELILIEKLKNGTLKKTNLIPVQFVPLIRGNEKNESHESK